MDASQAGRLEAGVIGRTLRLMLGLLLGWMVFTVLRSEDAGFGIRVLAVFAGISFAYVLLHAVINRYGSGLNRWLGGVSALAPIVLLFAIGGSSEQLAAVGFVGLSLLLQTIRADAGCVVMAIPALLSRRPTHLAGVLFAPIDWIERHLTGPGGLPG